MRIGSLFSGAGGLDLAVEAVFGGEVIWQAEIDKAASKVLAYRFPCAPNLGDITQIDWKTVEPPDILCGGFPCQDVSAAGKRAGIKDGTRSGLWSVFADAIDQLRPPLVVIENVRGLLSAQAHRNVEPDQATVGDRSDGPVLRALGAVLGDLADLGYDAQWATVAASSVGAPHRRERVFVVATDTSSGELQRWGIAGVVARPSSEIEGLIRSATGSRSKDATDSEGDGWDEGRPELARIVGGSDAAVGGDGHVDLLPTPRASDPCGAESRSSEGFRPQLGEVVRELCQADKVISTEDDGAMSVLTTDSGKDQTVVVTSDGDGVAVDVGSGEKSHNNVVAPELAGTKLDLLPTPTTQDGANCAGPSQFQRNSLPLNAVAALLPTPNASDSSGGGQHPDKRAGHSRQLIDYALLLDGGSNAASEGRSGEVLRDMRDATDPQTVRQRPAGGQERIPAEDSLFAVLRELSGDRTGGFAPLEGAADQAEGKLRGLRHHGAVTHSPQGSESGEQQPGQPGSAVRQLPSEAALAGRPGLSRDPDSGSRWGRYEAAIRRWEAVLGRPAPEPTEPNKNGNPRLAAEFSSWMMGWPAGWVTDPDIGISRNDQLKIIGNGVCPQQAIAALRYLLTVSEVAA